MKRQATLRSPNVFVGREPELGRVAADALHVRLVLVYGFAGVGKTSFMLRAAETLASRNGARVVYHRCAPGEGARSLRDSLLAGSERLAPQVIEEAAREGPIVACLDDAHQLTQEGIEAVVHLARLGLEIWLFLSSRIALPVSPTEVDHLMLRLEPLSRGEARELWGELERLYGAPQTTFERTFERGGGSPLRLKQAFARPFETAPGDPFGLEELEPHAAELLGDLCAFDVAVPVAAAERGRSLEVARATLRELSRRFLIEPAGERGVMVHDLVREAVLASPLAPRREHHRRCLEHWEAVAAGAPPDLRLDVTLVWHAVHAECDERALALLLEYASHERLLVPLRPALERRMLDAIERLGARRTLPEIVVVLAAHLEALLGRPGRATATLAAMENAGPHADLVLGHVAFGAGALDSAIERLQRALGATGLNARARGAAAGAIVDAHRFRGAIGAARAALSEHAALFEHGGPASRALAKRVEGQLAYDEGRYAVAARAFDDARRSYELDPVTLDFGAEIVPIWQRLCGALRGRPTASSDPDELFDETPFVRIAAHTLYAEELLVRGQIRRVLAIALRATAAASDAGFSSLASRCAWLLGEALLVLASPERAEKVVEHALDDARALGHELIARRLASALVRARIARGDPNAAEQCVPLLALADLPKTRDAPMYALLQMGLGNAEAALSAVATVPGDLEGFDAAEWRLSRLEAALENDRFDFVGDGHALEREAHAAGWDLVRCRALVLSSEAELRRGGIDTAQRLLTIAEEVAETGGYVGERLAIGFLRIAELRRLGDLERARDRARACRDEASAHGREPERAAFDAILSSDPRRPPRPGCRLPRRLGLHQAPTLALRSERFTWWLSADEARDVDRSPFDVVVDVPHGALVARGWSLDLTKRRTLLSLLSVLLSSPNETVSANALVERAWGESYHPVRYHSRLTMAFTRLRRLLAGRLELEGTRDGYRAKLAGRALVIEPGSPPAISSHSP